MQQLALPGDWIQPVGFPQYRGRIEEIGIKDGREYVMVPHNGRTNERHPIYLRKAVQVLDTILKEEERSLPRLGDSLSCGTDEGILQRITLRQGVLRYHVRGIDGERYAMHPGIVVRTSTDREP